jgi:hypothetical protein
LVFLVLCCLSLICCVRGSPHYLVSVRPSVIFINKAERKPVLTKSITDLDLGPGNVDLGSRPWYFGSIHRERQEWDGSNTAWCGSYVFPCVIVLATWVPWTMPHYSQQNDTTQNDACVDRWIMQPLIHGHGKRGMTDRGTILNRQSSLTIRLRPYLKEKKPFCEQQKLQKGRTDVLSESRHVSNAGKTRASTVARHRLPEPASGDRR